MHRRRESNGTIFWRNDSVNTKSIRYSQASPQIMRIVDAIQH